MSELEELRAEIERLRNSNRKALALAVHCLAVQQDAKDLLTVLMTKYRAAMKLGVDAYDFDELMAAVLLAVASVALKQRPGDPEVLEFYDGLKPADRH